MAADSPSILPDAQPKYMHFFIMLFTVTYITVDITAYRMVDFFGQSVPASGFIIPIVFWFNDIIVEVYGYRTSRKMIWNLLVCQFVFGLLITFILSWPSPEGNTLNASYEATFANILRVNVTSCVTILLGMFVNSILMSKWKVKWRGRFFWLRAILASAFSELLICFTAYFMLYSGLKPVSFILTMIATIWFYRLVFSLIAAPVAMPVCNFLKRLEQREVYDHEINYNPLRYNG